MNREIVLVADCPNSIGGITAEPAVVNDCGIYEKGRIDEMVTGDCARAGEGERAVNENQIPADGSAEDASVLRILADSNDRAELIVER